LGVRRLAPRGGRASRAHVVELNVDKNPAVAARSSTSGVPTLLFFRRGCLRDRHVGVASRAVTAEPLAALLRADVA